MSVQWKALLYITNTDTHTHPGERERERETLKRTTNQWPHPQPPSPPSLPTISFLFALKCFSNTQTILCQSTGIAVVFQPHTSLFCRELPPNLPGGAPWGGHAADYIVATMFIRAMWPCRGTAALIECFSMFQPARNAPTQHGKPQQPVAAWDTSAMDPPSGRRSQSLLLGGRVGHGEQQHGE